MAATQLVCTMLGMGAVMKIDDFIYIFKLPKSLFIGLGCQLLLVPAIAYLSISMFNINNGIIVGILLVAALPGGTVSNLYAYLGKGNAALSISLTCLVTLGCLVTTPLILKMMASQFLPATFSMPVLRIVKDIALFLLVPLAAGMYIGNKFPNIKERFSKWCIRISILVIVFIVIGALGSGRINIIEYGISMPVFITGFAIVIGVICALIACFSRLSSPDGFAIGIEVVVRNTNLGLLLAASLFPATAGKADPVSAGVIYTVLYYGGTGLLVPLLPIFLHRKMAAKISYRE